MRARITMAFRHEEYLLGSRNDRDKLSAMGVQPMS